MQAIALVGPLPAGKKPPGIARRIAVQAAQHLFEQRHAERAGARPLHQQVGIGAHVLTKGDGVALVQRLVEVIDPGQRVERPGKVSGEAQFLGKGRKAKVLCIARQHLAAGEIGILVGGRGQPPPSRNRRQLEPAGLVVELAGKAVVGDAVGRIEIPPGLIGIDRIGRIDLAAHRQDGLRRGRGLDIDRRAAHLVDQAIIADHPQRQIVPRLPQRLAAHEPAVAAVAALTAIGIDDEAIAAVAPGRHAHRQAIGHGAGDQALEYQCVVIAIACLEIRARRKLRQARDD